MKKVENELKKRKIEREVEIVRKYTKVQNPEAQIWDRRPAGPAPRMAKPKARSFYDSVPSYMYWS